MQHTKYAHQDYFGIQHYFAIQPNGDFIKVIFCAEMPSIFTAANYTAPEVWAPITREEFIAAYEKAQKAINESFVKSCGFEPNEPEEEFVGDIFDARALTMAEGPE